MRKVKSCLIVGAGIAGLTAARTLRDYGIQVTVVEKGDTVGGRMTTGQFAGGTFDYGAQYFTARRPQLLDAVTDWQTRSLVKTWANGFPTSYGEAKASGEPRYCGVLGMRSIPEYLVQDIDLHLNTMIIDADVNGTGWEVATQAGQTLSADALILAMPIPPALAALGSVEERLPSSLREDLMATRYVPCIAVMAVLDGPSSIPHPGGLWFPGEPLRWMADNHQKGISPEKHCITLHAGEDFTRQHWDADQDVVAQMLLDHAERWIGSNVEAVMIHRWRYSRPTVIYKHRYASVSKPAPLVFVGDVFAGPRVEGAVISGHAGAQHLLDRVSS